MRLTLCLIAVAIAVAAPVAAQNEGTSDIAKSRAPSVQPAVTAAVLFSDERRTTFRLDLSVGVTAEIFTLPDPYRVIVDLPDVSFRLPGEAGKRGQGLVKTFRYGLFDEGKARLVLDTTGPVRVENAAMVSAPGGSGVVFTFDMVETVAAAFGGGTGPKPSATAREPAVNPPVEPSERGGRPVIMIDPGHGGIDGGALGVGSTLEKNLVLAVAREVRSRLAASGRYVVKMTRDSDVFVSLDGRTRASRDAGADLFISLHADSLADEASAQAIRGATVYTLSERASDDQARKMAEKENASDLVAGLSVKDDGEAGQVKDILFDLMRRETSNFSADFSNVLVRKLRRSVGLSRAPQRGAAFKVLKQSHAPSVLVELGYLSHVEDERLMNTVKWQKEVALAVAAAVDAYFASRPAHGTSEAAAP